MFNLYLYNKVLNFFEINFKNNLYRKKLFNLRNIYLVFLNNFKKNSMSNQLNFIYSKLSNKILLRLNINVKIAGRIVNKRIIGKTSFYILQDIEGKIQICIILNNMYNIKYYNYFKKFDIGDFLGVEGFLFKTKTNELTVFCNKIHLLTKSIRLLPNKFRGLLDKNIKYYNRCVDLILNNKSLIIFKIRSSFIYEIRSFMHLNNFIEVETPILQHIPGGASACPFITYNNFLDINMYLRISPEIYLKKIIIGGFEKIFEINRSFRNEGVSIYHNPEFTILELYMSYTNYFDLIYFLEDFFRFFIIKFFKNNYFSIKNNYFIFPFVKISMKESICFYYFDINLDILDNIIYLCDFAKYIKCTFNFNDSIGKIQTKIFENYIEKFLIKPTIITNFPIETSPLARRNNLNPFLADRFEFFINGIEIGNGFSELNDPEDQSMRFYEQKKNKIFYDYDYISSMEYGLPPTSGLGIGIDRLIMLFTNSVNIRDVILFPYF